MNGIRFPLEREDSGSQVADLQEALQLLLFWAAILADDEAARP
jgi:hypothetical protein